MPPPNIQNRGWAAFDRKQRGVEASKSSEHDVDPFPSISNITSHGHARSASINNISKISSFSSVLLPSLDFKQLVIGGKNMETSSIEDCNCQATPEANNCSDLKLLKDIHSWADENLIEDVLAAVNNDIDQASVILKVMALPSSEGNGHTSASFSKSYEDSDGKDKLEIAFENKELNGTHNVVIKNRLIAVPNEPEWEEDDIYLSHRKNAMKMMRAASHHSKAASNAFLRGDHVSAHQFSLRSSSERTAAENLNNKAAEEIFRIRNSNNDIWKIDFHGLHAAEAVEALKNRLCIIESKVMTIHNRRASSDGLTQKENGVLPCTSTDPVIMSDANIKTKNLVPVLQVITGTGTHSKGQAALPVAIRSFLIGNGYHFDDARPGAFAVRPKFRSSLKLNAQSRRV